MFWVVSAWIRMMNCVSFILVFFFRCPRKWKEEKNEFLNFSLSISSFMTSWEKFLLRLKNSWFNIKKNFNFQLHPLQRQQKLWLREFWSGAKINRGLPGCFTINHNSNKIDQKFWCFVYFSLMCVETSMLWMCSLILFILSSFLSFLINNALYSSHRAFLA